MIYSDRNNAYILATILLAEDTTGRYPKQKTIAKQDVDTILIYILSDFCAKE